jgi:hypothetical protein
MRFGVAKVTSVMLFQAFDFDRNTAGASLEEKR